MASKPKTDWFQWGVLVVCAVLLIFTLAALFDPLFIVEPQKAKTEEQLWKVTLYLPDGSARTWETYTTSNKLSWNSGSGALCFKPYGQTDLIAVRGTYVWEPVLEGKD